MKARQKKRIKDTAALVKNVKEMHDDMHALYIEYDLDLKDFFFSLAESNKPSVESHPKDEEKNGPVPEVNFSLANSQNASDKKESEKDKKSQKRKAPPKSKGRPPKRKIKELYRAIMKLCHPDKMRMENLEEREYYRRKMALKISTDAYPKEDFEGLIFAAALVEIYIEGVSEKEYIENLNRLYSRYSEDINRIQTSLEWAWGTNWDTLESRYKIIEAVCRVKGVALPPKIEVIEKLVRHETK